MGRHGTIAGRKAAQDARRSNLFTKYARAITVAAKAGGDPGYNALEDSIEVVSKLLFTPVNHMCDFFAFATIHYFNDFFSSFSFCQHQQSFWTTPKKVDMEKDLVHDYSRHKKRKKSNGTIPTL